MEVNGVRRAVCCGVFRSDAGEAELSRTVFLRNLRVFAKVIVGFVDNVIGMVYEGVVRKRFKESSMRKMILVMLLCVPISILAAQQSNEFAIEIQQINQSPAVVIVNYNGTSTRISIPANINGYPVVVIGDNAFRSRRIESVVFPDTILVIGNYAFYDNRLTSVSLPRNVISVGIGAFDNNQINDTVPSPQPSSASTYTRAVTIEPVHNETVYVPKAAQTVPNAAQPFQNNNIIVVPSYNPLNSLQQGHSVFTTVQQHPNTPAAPAPSAPVSSSNAPAAATDIPPSNQPVNQPNLTLTETDGSVAPRQTSRRPNAIEVVPQSVYDLRENRGNTEGDLPTVSNDPTLKVYTNNIYQLWQRPVPR
jgi:hypothetical protein